jgi:hypothetical protein
MTHTGTTDTYATQVDEWTARHKDTPIDRTARPGTWILDVYYAADHAEALAMNKKVVVVR